MNEQLSPEAQRAMIIEARQYASVSDAGVTVNDPKKYTAFRDGQMSGYRIAQSSQPLQGASETLKSENNENESN